MAAYPTFTAFISQVLLQMKFFLSFILVIFLFVMNTKSMAQTDSVQRNIITDTTLRDSLPSSLFIAGISIYGNKKTKSYIIEREIPFKTGSTVTPAELAKDLVIAQQNLVNTSLFLEAYIYIEHRYGQYVFITVFVKERWYIFPLPYFKYIDPNFNTWWVTYDHTLKRTNYGIKFLHSNITGRNDKLTVWLITGFSPQIAVKYERPYFDKQLKSGFTILTSYTNQRELNYTTDSSKQIYFRPDSAFFVRKAFKIEGDYVYRPGLHIRHIFRLGYVYEKVADTILALNPDYFADGKTTQSFPYIGYTFRYTNADYNFYPTKGWISETTILYRGINSEMNLTQLTSINSYTIPVLPKTQISFKEGAVINLPFNQPFYNKSLFGYYGGIFMRGYEYYVIDGDVGAVGRATLQHELFSITTKVNAGTKKQVSYPFRFYGQLFGDLGYAYSENAGNSLLNNKLLHSWGLGFDMVAPYDVIFKFEYSFNQLGGNGLYIHLVSDF